MYSPYPFHRLLLIVTIFIFINACHKPNDDAPDGKEYVVTEIKYDNGINDEQFYYNDAWQLIERRETVQTGPKKIENIKYNYTYNSDGLVARVNISLEFATYMYVGLREMGYNNNGRLVTVSEYGKGTNTLLYVSEYEYIGNTIIKKFYANSILVFTCTYTVDDNRNIIKAITNYASGTPDLVEEWLDYDDKQNLLGPIAGDVRSKNNYRRHIVHGGLDVGKIEIATLYSYKNGIYVNRFINMSEGNKSGKANVTWVAKQ